MDAEHRRRHASFWRNLRPERGNTVYLVIITQTSRTDADCCRQRASFQIDLRPFCEYAVYLTNNN